MHRGSIVGLVAYVCTCYFQNQNDDDVNDDVSDYISANDDAGDYVVANDDVSDGWWWCPWHIYIVLMLSLPWENNFLEVLISNLVENIK